MNDSELRHQLLSMYNILLNHLTVTSNLEEMVQALIERDPDLKQRFEIAQNEEREEAARSDAPPLLNTADLLLRVRRTIHQLGDQSQ
jgi:hypothetical protein